jgi:glycosyltransferase involved in cell wall biosynthesis
MSHGFHDRPGGQNLSKHKLSNLAIQFKQKVSKARIQTHDVYGHVDDLVDGVLFGWALAPKTPHIPVLVKCAVGERSLDPVLAVRERPDVAAANYGTGTCGYALDLKQLLKSIAKETESDPITIEVLAGYQRFEKIGSWKISRWMVDFGVYEKLDPNKTKKLAAICAQTLMRAEGEVRERIKEFPFLDELSKSRGCKRKDLSGAVTKVVAPTTFPDTLRSLQGKKLVLSNYVDQQRYRFNVSRSFRVELADSEVDAYLHWYLSTYAPIRGWRRAPLSAEEIEHLNGPSAYPGATLAMSFFMPGPMREMARETEAFRLELAYWWSIEAAPARFLEDCLVPDWCIALLRKSRNECQGMEYPLNHFIERYFAHHKELHFLDLTHTTDRMLLYFYLILLGAERPDMLRFLPPKVLGQLLATTKDRLEIEESIAQLVARIFQALELDSSNVSPNLLIEMINARMFDIKEMRFRTMSTEGHRLLPAAWTVPGSDKRVDVQVIGPLQKASGLGQATRLSTAMLQKTGLKIGTFDFGLDNPAPEGFSSKVQAGNLSNSRINIVHLNAESVQLAYSFLPDVFGQAYNIGYFYWELDTPAACHHLSIELLDEIWVSSEYCREIYARATSKPVINVGMCVESLDLSDSEDARSYARRKLYCFDDEFVFLAAFDSFSFVQRKNPIGVIRAFRAAFPNDRRMRLVVKTHNRSLVQDPQQLRIWSAVDEEIAKDDRITLLDETLSYRDLRKLKSGVDCYVSLHRSEGWGFGMIEAMATGVPVVATGYSGNMDFCRPEFCWLVDFDLVNLYPDDYIFVLPGQKWAEPKFDSAVQQMRAVAYDAGERERRTRLALEFVNSQFSEESISKRYRVRLEQILADLTAPVDVQRRNFGEAPATAMLNGLEELNTFAG